jgi:hypothetical protein
MPPKTVATPEEVAESVKGRDVRLRGKKNTGNGKNQDLTRRDPPRPEPVVAEKPKRKRRRKKDD